MLLEFLSRYVEESNILVMAEAQDYLALQRFINGTE